MPSSRAIAEIRKMKAAVKKPNFEKRPRQYAADIFAIRNPSREETHRLRAKAIEETVPEHYQPWVRELVNDWIMRSKALTQLNAKKERQHGNDAKRSGSR